jgi:hypothetical protein
MTLSSISQEALIFNLEVLADLENNRAYLAKDYKSEKACLYRESILREAIRRLGEEV